MKNFYSFDELLAQFQQVLNVKFARIHSESMPVEIFLHLNASRLTKTQKHQIYILWSKVLNSDCEFFFRTTNPFETKEFIQKIAADGDLYVDNRENVHYYRNSCHLTSDSYQTLEHCDILNTIPVLVDGDWVESDQFAVKNCKKRIQLRPTNFIVGLDIVIENLKSIPHLDLFVGQNRSNACIGESSADFSLAMLRSSTKSLQTLARSLYAPLIQIFERKLVVDLIIYFLVRDAHRCYAAIFYDQCPQSLRQEMQRKVLLPVHLPFHPDGYFFKSTITVTSDQDVKLIAYANKNQKTLSKECDDHYVQIRKEVDIGVVNGKSICFTFDWRLPRISFIICSSEPLAEIDIKFGRQQEGVFFCKNTKEILLQCTKDFYWYSVSLLSTHNHYDVLFKNVLYNARVMQIIYPFHVDGITMKLTTETNSSKSAQIVVYSQILNHLATYVAREIVGPLFCED